MFQKFRQGTSAQQNCVRAVLLAAVLCGGLFCPVPPLITAPPLLRAAAAAAAAPCVPLTPPPLQVHGGGDSTASVGGWGGSCAELEKVSDAT